MFLKISTWQNTGEGGGDGVVVVVVAGGEEIGAENIFFVVFTIKGLRQSSLFHCHHLKEPVINKPTCQTNA